MKNLAVRSMQSFYLLSLLSLFLCVFFAEASAAQTEEERVAALVEGAKKEKKILLYTVNTVADTGALLKKFRERHPYIEPVVYRSNSFDLLNRVQAEAQAKRHLFDVLLTTGIPCETLKKKGLLTIYLSPERKFFPAGLKDPEGYWTDTNVSLSVVGYNTNLVASREVPKTWNDLLNPRWKGKMGMSNEAFYWFANMLKVMGEEKGLEYMKKLSQQNIVMRTGRTLLTQLMAAGELSIGIAVYNHTEEVMKAAGAPIDWVPIEPVVPEIHPVAISAHASHPNAARLLVDFLLSREGQELVANSYKVPSRIDVDPLVPRLKKGFKILPFDFSIGNDYERYIKIYREIFLNSKMAR